MPWVFAQYRSRGYVTGMERIPAVYDEAIERGLDAIEPLEKSGVIDHVGLHGRIGLELIDYRATILLDALRRDFSKASGAMAIE